MPVLTLALALLLAPGDLTLRGKECRIKTNVPAKEARSVPAQIDKYCANFAAFYDDLGLEPKSNNKVVIRLFATYEEYEEFYRRSTPDRSPPAAYYSPSLNGVVAYYDPDDPYLRQVLFHETSHQYIYRYTFFAPKWTNEGLAEYFEGWRLEPDGTLIEKRPPFYDLLILQKALESGQYLAPKKLIEMESKAFMDFRENNRELHGYLHYATAWGLTWYFLEGPDAADRTRYIEYFERLCEDGERAEPFAPDDWSQFEERWRTFILGIKLKPETADDHVILAANLRDEREYEDAIVQYRAALEKAPETPDLSYWIGYCYKRNGEYDEAAKHLEKAAEADEDDPRPLYQLARITAGTDMDGAKGDPERALDYAKRASKCLKDKNAVYLSFVARCQHLAGDAKGAKKTMRKVLKLVKDADEAVQASYQKMMDEM